MRIVRDPTLTLGWVTGKHFGPDWEASFFVKGDYVLRPDEVAVPAAEPALVSGDLYEGGDPANGLRYPSDFAPFKPRADVLVVGAAHAPGGRAAPTFNVRFRVGDVSKTLRVSGPRTWGRPGGTAGATFPRPVTSVPLTYGQAFGGPGFARNPLGVGWNGDALPAVEDPARPVRSPRDDDAPAGFAPVPPAWPQRAALLGSYAGDWAATRWPWFPDDFDWGHFNAAPRDQQREGYLRGNETIELENLRPDRSLYRSWLPGLRVRLFRSEQRADEKPPLTEVPLVLDTAWIDADAERLVLVWRGHAKIRGPKMPDVQTLFAFAEPMAQSPATTAQAEAMLAERTADPDESPAALAAAAAADQREATSDAEFNRTFEEMDAGFAEMDAEFAQLEAQAEASEAAAIEQLLASGGDPALYQVGTPIVDFAGVAAAQVAATAQLPPESQAGMEPVDLSPDAEMAEMDREAAEWVDDDEPRPTRDRVAEAAARGVSLAEGNYSGLDLSGLVLAGAVFAGARLDKCKLTGTNLAGADLRDANLRGADLAGADLTGANLDDADLSRANLAGAKLTKLSLADATLSGLALAGADFSGSVGGGADFSNCDLSGATFTGANLPRASFTESMLMGTDFAGAVLSAARFNEAKAAGAKFAGADLRGIHANDGADFTGADLRGVDAAGSTWDDAKLDKADLSRAKLLKAQFGGASLRETNLDRADLSGATFDDAVLASAKATNANFLRAAFDRADLSDADFTGSNLYGAGFWDAIDDRTTFRDANLKGTSRG